MTNYGTTKCLDCGIEVVKTGPRTNRCPKCTLMHKRKIRNAWHMQDRIKKGDPTVGLGRGGSNKKGEDNPLFKTGMGRFYAMRKEMLATINHCERCGKDLTNASRTTNNTNTNSNTTPNTRNERRVINTPTSGLVNADVIRNPTASGWINEFGERYRNIRRSINTATANRQRVDPSFYEARQRAKSNGAKSFTWHGQTYSTYGASNNTTNTYGKKK